MNVIEAIKKRASIRAFLNKPVELELIQKILDAARFAPSDKNTQPWYVAVITGDTQKKLSADLIELCDKQAEPNPDFDTEALPKQSIYYERAFKCGMDLYSALQIDRRDKQKRQQQWRSNFQFFNAPVGLFFFTDKQLGVKAVLDNGMFIQSVMLAAVDLGLATCAQGAMAFYPDTVRKHVSEIFQDKLLLCGMSLGYPDMTARENNYRTERAAINEFTEFFS